MEEPLQRRIQLTGFREVEKDALIELIFKLDCVFIDSEKFENCTHLIAKKPCKSEKWLSACATGKWVLTKDYIINSAETGRWLDETNYEWGYKIERDSHYSPLMQSAPKRWRENLTCTGALGAFSRWKVLVHVKDGRKEREAFIRVLKAGRATLCNPQDSTEEITHVFTSDSSLLGDERNKLCNAPHYSVQYIGTFLLEEPIACTSEETGVGHSLKNTAQEKHKDTMPDGQMDDVNHSERKNFCSAVKALEETPVALDLKTVGQEENVTDEQIDDIKSSIWKHFCFAQTYHHKTMKQDFMVQKRCKISTDETKQVTLNRIEGLLEGQFLVHAFQELAHLVPSSPPAHILQLFLKHLIQGNVDISCFSRFFDILCTLLRRHPPWESPYMVQYYLDCLQCPICKKGAWPFMEMMTRSYLENHFCLCHQPTDLETDPRKRRTLLLTLLKFVTTVMQEETKALSKRVCECADFKRNAMPPSFIVKLLWSETRTPQLLTSVMRTLTDLVLRCHKEMNQEDNVFLQELAYYLNAMLGAAVEYWIFLGFYMNKNLIHQVSMDLVSYIYVACEDFSLEEKEKFISCISSRWLQMLVSDAFFTNICIQNKLHVTSEPLSLEKLICSYLPLFWLMGTSGSEKEQKLKEKMKIGQRPCLESQRALLMLNGENQNQGEVLLDLPEFPTLRRRTDGGSVCIKENLPSALQGLPYSKQNLKGETALHIACINNKVKKLILLLSLPGTSINAKDNAGWTPLHEACNHGSTECVREILQHCPEVDLLSHVDGVTPLHDALLNGHVDIAKMLLQYGGQVLLQQRDLNGRFPLDYVASPHLKKELFDILQVNETIEDFHACAAQTFQKSKVEFSAFLLCRILMNFFSVYNLPSNSIAARMLYPNAAALIKQVRTKGKVASFSDWLVERYMEDLITIQKLTDILQAIPEAVVHNGGFNVRVLIAILQTMVSH
ncbi:SMC5-SMC6 complex localization factor protein 1 isoform 2-T3 [Discoglossus pictus]